MPAPVPRRDRRRCRPARLGEAAEAQLAERVDDGDLLDGREDPLADEDLAALRLGAQACREVGHAADGRVVGAALEADLAKGRVALRDPHAEVQGVVPAGPSLGQFRDAAAHRQRHADRALRCVGAVERVVEDDHEPVAREALERAVEAVDEVAERGVVLAQHGHDVLRLHGLGEAREAAQVAEDDGDLATVAAQEGVVAGRDHELRELRRQEAPQPAEALEGLDLRLDPLLELAVPGRELVGLRLDRVVVALDAQQRVDSRKQLRLVERLGDEVVGARLDRSELLLLAAGGDHHDGQEAGGDVGPERPADLVAVHLRHQDVQQDEIDRLCGDALERLTTRVRRDHVVAARGQDRLQQPHVLRKVVDHEDPRGARSYLRSGECGGDLARKLADVQRLLDVVVEPGRPGSARDRSSSRTQ